jgi:hypothetical protein
LGASTPPVFETGYSTSKSERLTHKQAKPEFRG